MSRCIIDVACNGGYPDLQKGFLDSAKVHTKIPVLAWTKEYPPGSPEHKELPYAFKAYAFEHAFKEHDHVIWFDCNVKLHKPPEPLFEILERDGYLIMTSDAYIWEWSGPELLALMGRDIEWARNDAKMPVLGHGGVFGFSKTHPMGQKVWSEFRRFIIDEKAALKQKEAIRSVRVMGRNEEVVLALLANNMDLKVHVTGEYCYGPNRMFEFRGV